MSSTSHQFHLKKGETFDVNKTILSKLPREYPSSIQGLRVSSVLPLTVPFSAVSSD